MSSRMTFENLLTDKLKILFVKSEKRSILGKKWDFKNFHGTAGFRQKKGVSREKKGQIRGLVVYRL